MGEEFLAKAKGFSRTFLIHSNNNPYAAAAAMGMMAARSQEAGRYFRPSDSFVPQVAGLAAEEMNTDSSPDQIDTDFKGDWVDYLRTIGLPACGLKYKDGRSPEENTIRFLNANNRRIPINNPRTVRESSELFVPEEFRQEYQALVSLIESGGDLKPYLSRDILKKKRSDRNDGLLNSWGIQHLLFCIITVDKVFMIQVVPHDAEFLWVNTQLVQSLHDNWPELIARAKHNGLRAEDIPAAKRQSLRGYNANFPTTVADGTVYLPLAGGTMASGDSQEDRVNCDKIFSELKFWQDTVGMNVLAIRSAVNLPDSKKLTVHMAFDNRDCCFYEPTQAARLGGFAALVIAE
jgi:hypothetical protein